MTEENTFTVARGEVIQVDAIENKNRAFYSVKIKFLNEPKLKLATFHNIGKEMFYFFRDAMRNNKIVSFPDLQPGDWFYVYETQKCFISDDQKEQESPLTGQKES